MTLVSLWQRPNSDPRDTLPPHEQHLPEHVKDILRRFDASGGSWDALKPYEAETVQRVRMAGGCASCAHVHRGRGMN